MDMMIAPVAGAQTSGGQAAIAAGAPLPPAYVLESDGTVIIEGDVVTDCSSFVAGGFLQNVQERLQNDAHAVADECRQLGYPSGDLTTGNSDVILSLGTIGPPATADTGGSLPNTGGLPLAFAVLVGTLAGSLALIHLGGSMLKRASGYR